MVTAMLRRDYFHAFNKSLLNTYNCAIEPQGIKSTQASGGSTTPYCAKVRSICIFWRKSDSKMDS